MFFRVSPDSVKCTNEFGIRRLINYSEDEIEGETKNSIISQRHNIASLNLFACGPSGN